MEYFKNIQMAIEFVEKKLDQKISLAEVAMVACYSEYHFHRLFHLLVGETIGNYIRKRRLTEAMLDLKSQKWKIIDIAFKYQFESQEAFSRTFKKYFRITPQQCRDTNCHVQLFPKKKLSFNKQLAMERKNMMKPRNVEKASVKSEKTTKYRK
ncbi:MAG: helix-turn-helix transcriptional regulator [Spirochaetes bacterium]|nr:helix-turn-helix transcriptional regulator [Spirochaetota bacterium]